MLDESNLHRQSLLSFVSVAVIALLGFVAVIFFAQYLGAELMGVYYLFFTYLAIFELIGNGGVGSVAQKVSSGVDSAVQKFVAEGENEQNEYFSAYLVIRLGFTVIATCLMLGFSGLVEEFSTYQLTAFLVLALLAGAFSGMMTSGIRAKRKISWYSVANLLSQIVYYVVAVVLLVLGFSLGGIFTGYVVGLVLLGVLALFVFRYKICKFTKKHFVDILSYSVWSIIIGGIAVIMSATDTFLLNMYDGNSAVGIYRVALHVTLIALLSVNAVNIAISPKMSRAFGDGNLEEISYLAKNAITYGLMLAIPALVGGALIGDGLLYAFYGSEFVSGIWSMVVLFLYQCLYVILSVCMIVFENIRKIRISCIILLIGFVINFVLDLVLIPVIGMLGASLASLVAVVFNVIVCVLILRKYVAIPVDTRRFMNILSSSIGMAVVVGIIRFLFGFFGVSISLLTVLVLVFAGAVTYFILLCALDKEVWSFVNMLISKVSKRKHLNRFE